MKNDTTFVRMRSCDHLGDAKMLKKAPRSIEFNFFLLIAIDRNGFCRMKGEGQIYKPLPQIFLIFAKGLSYDLSNLMMILPRFSTMKDHN